MAIEFNPSISTSLTQNITRASEQIASGRRINRAADDPAGFGVTVTINTRIGAQESAISNAIAGISLIQTAQSGLGRISEGLQQLRELAIQAGNGTLTSADRDALQTQADQLLAGIRENLTNARFNGLQPLASEGTIELQVGADADDRFSIPSRDLGAGLDDLGLNEFDLTDPGGLAGTLDSLDRSLELVTSTAATFGASQNRLESTLDTLQTSNFGQAESASRIEDTDLARAVSELVRSQVQQRAQIALQAQANAQRGQVLSLLSR